jgi:hypothetical protein
LYVIEIQEEWILAAAVPEETAAALFDAGHSIILADHGDLARLAKRHEKMLSVLIREPKSGSRDPRRVRTGALPAARRISKGAALGRRPAPETVVAAVAPVAYSAEVPADESAMYEMELC